ncbi:hypothetical protein COOONC_01665 [Cooperia oncophora]
MEILHFGNLVAIKDVDRCSTSSGLVFGIQENIYSLPQASVSSRVNAMTEAIKYWWSQLRVVGTVGTGVTFRSSQSGSPISYFTRMAWATTSRIGCAVTQKNKDNIPDTKIYTPGNACSQCQGGYRCSSDKLCARSNTTIIQHLNSIDASHEIKKTLRSIGSLKFNSHRIANYRKDACLIFSRYFYASAPPRSRQCEAIVAQTFYNRVSLTPR